MLGRIGWIASLVLLFLRLPLALARRLARRLLVVGARGLVALAFVLRGRCPLYTSDAADDPLCVLLVVRVSVTIYTR